MTDHTVQQFGEEVRSFFVLVLLNMTFGALALAFGMQIIIATFLSGAAGAPSPRPLLSSASSRASQGPASVSSGYFQARRSSGDSGDPDQVPGECPGPGRDPYRLDRNHARPLPGEPDLHRADDPHQYRRRPLLSRARDREPRAGDHGTACRCQPGPRCDRHLCAQRRSTRE